MRRWACAGMTITLSISAIANILRAFFKLLKVLFWINEVQWVLLSERGCKNRKKWNTDYFLRAVYNVAMPQVRLRVEASDRPLSLSVCRKAAGFGNRSTDSGR